MRGIVRSALMVAGCTLAFNAAAQVVVEIREHALHGHDRVEVAQVDGRRPGRGFELVGRDPGRNEGATVAEHLQGRPVRDRRTTGGAWRG